MSKFKKLLDNRNINQSEFARKLNVSKQLVSCWVKGRALPKIPEVVKMANLLQVSIEEIVLCFTERM